MGLSIVEIAAAREQVQSCWTSRLAAYLLEIEPATSNGSSRSNARSAPEASGRASASDLERAAARKRQARAVRGSRSCAHRCPRASGARNVDSRVSECRENLCDAFAPTTGTWWRACGPIPIGRDELGEHHPQRTRQRTTKKLIKPFTTLTTMTNIVCNVSVRLSG